MTLTEVRAYVRQSTRNGASTSVFSDAAVDRVVQQQANSFIRRTHCTRQTNSIALAAGAYTVDLTAVTGFTPDRLLTCWSDTTSADDATLETVSFSVLNMQRIALQETGTPEFLAFTSATACQVYPTPTAACNISFFWFAPFTSWTAGASAAGVTSFNISDDYLQQICTLKVPAMLMQNTPEDRPLVQAKLADYEAFLKEAANAGNWAGRTILPPPRRTSGLRDMLRGGFLGA